MKREQKLELSLATVYNPTLDEILQAALKTKATGITPIAHNKSPHYNLDEVTILQLHWLCPTLSVPGRRMTSAEVMRTSINLLFEAVVKTVRPSIALDAGVHARYLAQALPLLNPTETAEIRRILGL